METLVFLTSLLRYDLIKPLTKHFALVKFGGGITAMTGSIAGNTYARNRYGFYVRARTKPVNPKSDRQTTVRARMQLLTEMWRDDLDATQRTAWETYAAAIAWDNKLGETIHLTGFNHFIRSNHIKLECVEPVRLDGPQVLALPIGDPLFQVAISAANGMTVTFDPNQDWVTEDGAFLVITHGQPQNATRNFFGGPWRFNGALGGDNAAPPGSPQGPWPSNVFTEVEGQRWWVKGQILRVDGRVSTPFTADSVIVAA